MHTNSQSQSSNTLNNALTRNRQILKLLFEETRSMFFKESSLVSMWEGPSAKVTKPFAAMPIYKASILFLDGQGIPNYLFNKELCYTPRKKKLFSSIPRKNLFLLQRAKFSTNNKLPHHTTMFVQCIQLQNAMCYLVGPILIIKDQQKFSKCH